VTTFYLIPKHSKRYLQEDCSFSVNFPVFIQTTTLHDIWQDYREETEKKGRGDFSFN